MFKGARLKRGLTLDEASNEIHVSKRALCNYESGETTPPSDVVLGMSRIYKEPWMTQKYCREYCAIGNAYSYVVLDKVNLDVPTVLIKLMEEIREANDVFDEMLRITVNKNDKSDFTDNEMQRLLKCVHEFLDLEHNIETLKISLNKWIDMAREIREHNEKCFRQGYAEKEKRPFQTAI
ncbi:helix-turn-helix domain-containing protein [Wukongibacter sp. M2B1]|uniref:helix-turn-helix domain-containing protein n=1 Tax=Wukongibacter sp. M2B1 TaxID=3088895 RepID=UPI003D7A3207